MMMYDLIKSLLLVFTGILLIIYWQEYGPTNFLWFSDIGLFLTTLALLFESSLIMSMAAVGLVVSELLWNVSFFWQLGTGRELLPLASYMFDPQYSLMLRGLSLFHIVLPIIWIYFIIQWGYDSRAFISMMCFMGVILLITYLFTSPTKNINWVFSPRLYNWKKISERQWILLQLASMLMVVWATHCFMLRFAKKR